MSNTIEGVCKERLGHRGRCYRNCAEIINRMDITGVAEEDAGKALIYKTAC